MKLTTKPFAVLGLIALMVVFALTAPAESGTETAVVATTLDKAEKPVLQLPLLIEGDHGEVYMSKINLEGDLASQLALLVAGACNGGSCSPLEGGPALDCPSSGGPDCGSGEACQCSCEGASTRNQCVELQMF